MKIRKYSENDVPAMVHIWNEVVEEGVAFPQLELLDKESGRAFFAAQTYCGVANDNGMVSSDFDGPFSDRVKEACRKILKKRQILPHGRRDMERT